LLAEEDDVSDNPTWSVVAKGDSIA